MHSEEILLKLPWFACMECGTGKNPSMETTDMTNSTLELILDLIQSKIAVLLMLQVVMSLSHHVNVMCASEPIGIALHTVYTSS
jgi:hypothetical protein